MMLKKLFAIDLPVIEVESVVEEATPVTNSDNTLLMVIVITAIVAIVAIVAVIILVCILKKQKKVRTVQSQVSYTQPKYVARPYVNQKERAQETQRLPKNSGNTQHLWGSQENNDIQTFLYLVDYFDNSRSFRAPIETQVIIGRKEGDIIISEDRSLSKCHCKIIKRGSVYYIEDLNSSNGTRYNGQLIQGETPILPGKVIEIGRQRLRMEIKEVTR